MLRRHLSLFLTAALATLAFAPAAYAEKASDAVIRRVYDPNNKTPLPASWTIVNNTYLSPKEYQDLKGGVMELLKRYPPDKYFFVGLGRDPAPVIAFLQNLGEKDLAVNLPGTSNIQWQGQVKPGDAVVARHIEAAIPKKILDGERTIVILDVTSSGKTPAVFGPYLDAYLKGRGNAKMSVKLAFSWSNVKAPGAGYATTLTDWIDTTQWPDYAAYYGGKYEGGWTEASGGSGIAEHQRHSMTPTATPPTKTSPNYKAFRDALMKRMEQDAELDGFLSKLPSKPARKTFVRPVKPLPAWLPKFNYKLDAKRGSVATTALFSLRDAEGIEKEAAKAAKKAAKKAEKEAARAAKGKEPKEPKEPKKAKEPKAPKPESYDYLSMSEYGELRDGAVAIMNQASPSTAYYVGVGRSSAPLVALFENLGTDVATYLPADGLHKLANGGGGDASETLDKLFDAFIPEEALRGTRTIVLFQRSDTGASLPYLEQALKTYLSRKGSPAQVSILSLAEAKPAQGGFINISKSSELKALSDRKYHIVAPYDFFRPGKQEISSIIGKKGKPLPRSKAFGRFKVALKQRMTRDAVLDKAISVSRGK